MDDLSVELVEALESMGWFPGRAWEKLDVTVGKLREVCISVHPAAVGFLAEYGGLKFEHAGPGISVERAGFELDPSLAFGDEEMFTSWGELIGKELCPVGEYDEGRFFLAIDEEGCLYLVADWLASFGSGLRGFSCLLLGVAPETLYDSFP